MDAGRKSKSLKSVMTNLNFALEVMSRDIKFGKTYYCGITGMNPPPPQNCTGLTAPSNSVTFVTSNDVHTIYRLNNNQIEKSIDRGTTYIGVTAPEIIIQDLRFYVFGTGTNGLQPRVLVLIRGYVGPKPTSQSTFILQTTVSQRVLDS